MSSTPNDNDPKLDPKSDQPEHLEHPKIIVSSEDKGLYEALVSFMSEVVGTTNSWRILIIRLILFTSFGLFLATAFFFYNAQEDLLDILREAVYFNRGQHPIKRLPTEDDSPFVRALKGAANSLGAVDYGIVRYITPSTESYVYLSDPPFFHDLGYELNAPSARGDISRQIFTNSVFDECSVISLKDQVESINPRLQTMLRRGWGVIVACPFSDRYGVTGHVFLVLDSDGLVDSNEAVRLLRGVARPISYHLY